MIRFLKDFFEHHKIQKIAALIISASLWVYVMGSQDPIMKSSYKVPVTLANPSREYRVTYEEQTIEVDLTAPRSNFAEYKAADIHAFINAQNLAEGELELPVEVSFPKGFELNQVSPAKIHVKVDPYIEKQMQTEVIVNGTAVAGAVVKEILKSLEYITVIGPKTDVNSVHRVLGYVGLTGNTDDFEIKVPMTAIDGDGREVKTVRVVPSAINVFVDIESGMKKKTVPVVSEISPPAGREIENISIDPANIEITAKEETLNQITSIQTAKAVITAGKEEFDGNLKVVLPEGVTSDTSSVHVTVTLKK